MPKQSHRPTVFATGRQHPPPAPPEPLGYRVEPTAPHPYLLTRGLHDSTLEQFELDCVGSPSVLQGRVLIPLHNAAGELTGYAGSWPADPVPKERSKYRFVGHGEAEPFNLHRVLKVGGSVPILITAAPFDVFHLWQCGYESVIGLWTYEIRQVAIQRLLHHFPNRPFVLLFDETERGRRIRLELLDRLGRFTFVRAMPFVEDERTVASLTRRDVKEEL